MSINSEPRTPEPHDAPRIEVRSLFAPAENTIPAPGGKAVLYSVLTHAVAIGLVLLIASLIPERVYQSVLPERFENLVWVSVPGPGGGGGGSPKAPEPPRKAELPKVETPKPPAPTPEPQPEIPPPPEPPIPAQTLNVVPEVVPGTLDSTQASNASGSPEDGQGKGIGSGRGAGLGAGLDRGTGGGAFRPGNGVEIPRLLSQVRPQYTAEAMRARMQGIVQLECVVTVAGSVGNCEVTRSLDGNNFGLDQQALLAARQWRFAPGTRFGEPVPVLVTIELTFTLR